MLLSESFFQLLQSPGHWLFEMFLMVLFDGLVGYFAWPRIKRHFHRDIDVEHGHEQKIAGRVQDLEDLMEKMGAYDQNGG